MKIYIAEYLMREIDTGRNIWRTGFYAYKNRKQTEENAKKDFERHFTGKIIEYKYLDYIVKEIELQG